MTEKERIVRTGYNKIAKEYQADRGRFKHERELKRFASLLPMDARV